MLLHLCTSLSPNKLWVLNVKVEYSRPTFQQHEPLCKAEGIKNLSRLKYLELWTFDPTSYQKVNH